MKSMADAMEAPDLVAKRLVKIYGERTVVNGMDVTCRCGEIVGLLGPNGAVYKRARKGLGYLAQEASVFRKLTVWENVMAILETLPMKRTERRRRAEELLEPFDLMKVARQPAYTLSGGERRKLEIARALVRNPAILMLDEPFAGVDPLSVNEIQDIVRKLAKDGLGIIITDHNVRETLSVVDRAYMVYNGSLLKEGPTAELVADEEVRARYLGSDFRM